MKRFDIAMLFAGCAAFVVLSVFAVVAIVRAASVAFVPMSDTTDLVFSMIPLDECVAPGRPACVILLADNSTSIALPYTLDRVLYGQISTDKGTWGVQFEAENSGPVGIQPGEFGACEYRFTVPSDAVGRAIVEIEVDDIDSLQTVVEIAPPSPTGTVRSSKSALSHGESPQKP